MAATVSQHVASSDIEVRNPRTGELLYTVPEATPAQIAGVYANARAAQTVIAAMPVRDRLAELAKLRKYILANKESIIDRIVAECGKSRMDALMTEIFTVLDAIDYYEKNAERVLRDETVKTPVLLLGKKSHIYYEPIGPVLMITPWNYPFNLTLVPFACAFAAGNAVIHKPSEHTPLQGLLEEIFDGCGFVKHAIQVVYGGKDTGRALIDGRPAKILFTGSVRAGRQVMAQAAQYVIPVELELGGKDAMIVFDDANLERATNGAIWGGLTNSGQTCTAVERVLVHEKIHDQFVETLKRKIETLATPSKSTGEDDGNLDIGCMTTDFQVDIVRDQVDDAKANGATIVTGGQRVGGSHEFAPTVITNVKPDMKIVREETFGPVLVVQKFEGEDDALHMANDSPYGLSGSVWSGDIERAKRVARKMDTGSVSINNVLATVGNSALPFGGVKESGFGRYKGAHGLHAFCNVKSIMIDKSTPDAELNWYPYSKEKYGLFSKLIDRAYSGESMGTLKAMLVGLKLQGLAKKEKL